MTSGETRTGAALRRRVRHVTVGVLGAAVLASGAVTAGLSYAAGTDEQSAASTSRVVDSGGVAAVATAPSTTSSLTTATQAPQAAAGQSHAGSGGS